ncbi:MAG: BON domain-containing protein [Armatimonadota bacterium]
MRTITALLIILLLIMIPAMLSAQQRSDNDIQTELQRRIRVDPQVGSITISVQGGVVTITGTVNSLAQKQSIVNIARRTIGVRSVADRINVVITQRRSDADIERSVRQSLVGNLSKEELAAITIRSSSGVVTLTGTLPSSYPKQVAGVLASWVPGVVNIVNNIVVRPPEARTDAAILSDIQNRYRKNPFIQSQQIHVIVTSGVVQLTGIVDNHLAAEQAEAVARFVPGVVDVRNLLFIRAVGV